MQFAALGNAQEFVVGRGAPQEKAQPGRLGEGIEAHGTLTIRIGLELFDDEQERRRDQHAGQPGSEPLVERTELDGGSLSHGHRCIQLVCAQGSTVKQSTRIAEEKPRTLRVGTHRIGRRARNEEVTVFLTRDLCRDRTRHPVELLKSSRGDVCIRGADRQQPIGTHQWIEGAADRDLLAKDIGDDAPVLWLGQQTHAGFRAACRRRSAAAGREHAERRDECQ